MTDMDKHRGNMQKHEGNKRKYWTAEEEEFLEEKIGTFTADQIARRLGRSFSSVDMKLSRMGIGGFRQSTDMLTTSSASSRRSFFRSSGRTRTYGTQPPSRTTRSSADAAGTGRRRRRTQRNAASGHGKRRQSSGTSGRKVTRSRRSHQRWAGANAASDASCTEAESRPEAHKGRHPGVCRVPEGSLPYRINNHIRACSGSGARPDDGGRERKDRWN